MPRVPHLIAAAGLALALWLALAPPDVLTGDTGPALALTVAVIALLATGVVPEYFTAMLFFVVAMLFAVAPAAVVFSGFHSTAFWLVFGGLVIGVGVHRTGLGGRLANFIAGWFGGSYASVIFGIVVIGVVMAFLMPSTLGTDELDEFPKTHLFVSVSSLKVGVPLHSSCETAAENGAAFAIIEACGFTRRM